jgi:hypothetical protein
VLPPLSRAESEALARRRRGRNLVFLVALLGLAAMFYAIAVVKMAHPLSHG